MQDSSAFQYLSIDLIDVSTTNHRRTFDERKLQELAGSIKHNGMIQPIVVCPKNGRFEIIAGERRYRSSLLAEKFSVPSHIVELTDAQTLELQLIELPIVVKRFLFVYAGPTSFPWKRPAGFGVPQDKEHYEL